MTKNELKILKKIANNIHDNSLGDTLCDCFDDNSDLKDVQCDFHLSLLNLIKFINDCIKKKFG